MWTIQNLVRSHIVCFRMSLPKRTAPSWTRTNNLSVNSRARYLLRHGSEYKGRRARYRLFYRQYPNNLSACVCALLHAGDKKLIETFEARFNTVTQQVASCLHATLFNYHNRHDADMILKHMLVVLQFEPPRMDNAETIVPCFLSSFYMGALVIFGKSFKGGNR